MMTDHQIFTSNLDPQLLSEPLTDPRMTVKTLALDATAKPIGLIAVERAVSHIAVGLVDGMQRCQVLLANEKKRFRSQDLDIPLPLIVMWPGYVELEKRELKRVSRRVVFARDKFACQYCGYQAHPGKAFKELTVDHVKPAHLFAHRSEANNWQNVTTACVPCNRRKAGRLPRECGMMPKNAPKAPHYVQLRFAGRLHSAQRDYIADYFKLKKGKALAF